jgi:FixJ family two-component response regulator
MDTRALVSVVDDSEAVRESLPDLLRYVGYGVEAFASAEEFLASRALATTECLILDVGLPGMIGPDLTRRRLAIPIVFITAQGDASLRPQLVARGAVAVLFKPFTDNALLDAVTVALQPKQG